MVYTIEYLLQNSRLPGPRSNLELLYQFIENASETEIANSLGVVYNEKNTPEEFVLSCGVGASIYFTAKQHKALTLDLKHYANHESWRVREAICIGFQKAIKILEPGELLEYLEPLRNGSALEIRTYIATLCEPALLSSYIDPQYVLEELYYISLTHFDNNHPLDEPFKVLKKALGYCWSVAVSAPSASGDLFEKLLTHDDSKHIKWIIKENLKKKRMEKFTFNLDHK